MDQLLPRLAQLEAIDAEETEPQYDYERQLWVDGRGDVIPCAHPATMGPRCCEAYRLTKRRQLPRTERGAVR